MDEQEISQADARSLRFLRALVLVLTAVMIAGMVVLVVLFATRFPAAGGAAAGMEPPERLALPEGAEIAALTRSSTQWIAVTGAGDIYFFAPEGGAPIRHIPAQE